MFLEKALSFIVVSFGFKCGIDKESMGTVSPIVCLLDVLETDSGVSLEKVLSFIVVTVRFKCHLKWIRQREH